MEPFKNFLGLSLARELAEKISAVYPAFDADAFIAAVAARLEPLELKERAALMADALRHYLPSDFPAAAAILLAILGPDSGGSEGVANHSFWLMPVAAFVERHGLDYFDASVAAMYQITKRHTAEFTIRPFLLRYPEQSLAVLRQWVHDPNEHVRRLVSEGTRPRLPWGIRLPPFMADPTPALALLEQLKDDPSAYVRRSVANHLNDISKDNPHLVIATLQRWRQDAGDERLWIIRHALRSLVKAGDPDALALLGFGEAAAVTLHAFTITPAIIRLGEVVTLSFTLQNESDEAHRLVIDYVVHLVKANGRSSPKVFKLTTRALAGGERLNIQRQHAVRPVTTRRYYPGEHRVEIQVNGRRLGQAAFQLVE
jgi:3-methyladenine DNA glycosylase AlkC